MAHHAAILLAAGRGTRMGPAVEDKILASLGRQTVFAYSLAAFVDAGIVSEFVVVYRDAPQRARLSRVYEKSAAREWPVTWVRGGRERQDSVGRALAALTRRRGLAAVFIHDAARPLVRPEALRALEAAMQRDGAACLAHPVTDTIKRVGHGAREVRRRRLRTVPRERLWAMETPQAFEFAVIAGAYREIQRRRLKITDDAAALELVSRRGVTLVENPEPNPKLTRPTDFALAEFLLAARAPKP